MMGYLNAVLSDKNHFETSPLHDTRFGWLGFMYRGLDQCMCPCILEFDSLNLSRK